MPEDRPSDRKPPADGTVPLTPPGVMRGRGNQDRLLGQLVDNRFRIRGVLGEGGMGRVYLAEDEKLNRRRVALKLMGSSLTADPEFRARFHREAVLQANLPHPQIVQVLDIGECEDGAFIVMEYSDGRALSTLIKELGPRPLEKALDITAQILEILDFAHRQGVVHRDLKPSNILIEERAGREFVRVLDFGIAKLISRDGSEFGATLTKAGHAYGTLGYMAPEQAKGESEKLDHRADVYSVGIILHEMITGQVPAPPEARTHPVRYAMWVASNPVRPLRETHPELDVAEEVDNIIRSALRREPEKRYTSALAFLQAIREFRRHSEAATVRGPSARKGQGTEPLSGSEAQTGGKKAGAVAWIVAAVFLAAAGGLGWLWHQARGEAADLKSDVQKASDALTAQGVTSSTLAEGVAALAKRTPGNPAETEELKRNLAEVREQLRKSEEKLREVPAGGTAPAEWQAEKSRLEGELRDAKAKSTTAEAESARVAKQLEDAVKSGAAKDAEITALKAAAPVGGGEIATRLSAAEAERDRLKGEVESRDAEITALKAAAPAGGGEVATRLKAAEAERDRLKGEVETRNTELRGKSEELRTKDAEIARQKTRIDALEKGGGNESAALRDEAAAARSRADELDRRAKALEADLASEKTRAKEAEAKCKTAEQNELVLRREAAEARTAAEATQLKLGETSRNLEAERMETSRLKGVVESKDRELAAARNQPPAGASAEEVQRLTRERDLARAELSNERQRAESYAGSLRAAGIDPNTGRPYSSGSGAGGGGTVVTPPPPPPPVVTEGTVVCDIDVPGGSIRLEKIVVRPSNGASYEIPRSQLPVGTMVIGERYRFPVQGPAEVQVQYQRYNAKSSREGMRTTDWTRVGSEAIPLR